jgi:hypothetical protein
VGIVRVGLGWAGGAIALRSGVGDCGRLPVSCASSLKMICVGERLKVLLYAALESYSALCGSFASLSSNSAVAPTSSAGWRSSRTHFDSFWCQTSKPQS